MSKNLGEKAVLTRVTRSLRNRVVSIDSDTSSRLANSLKNELESIAEDDVKNENNSPSTPIKTMKLRKRRSSQSEISTPIRTPKSRSTVLLRRSSFSELESTPVASPLRRNTRRLSSGLQDNIQTHATTQQTKSPISVDVVLEENEEDEKSESCSGDKRITRSSSKSPRTILKKHDIITDNLDVSNQNKAKQLSKSSKNANFEADNKTNKESGKICGVVPRKRHILTRTNCIEEESISPSNQANKAEIDNLSESVNESTPNSSKFRPIVIKVEDPPYDEISLNVSDDEADSNNTEAISSALSASSTKSPVSKEKIYVVTNETPKWQNATNSNPKSPIKNCTTVNTVKVTNNDQLMESQDKGKDNENKSDNTEKVNMSQADKNKYELRKENEKMSDLPSVKVVPEQDEVKSKATHKESEFEKEENCNSNIKEHSTKILETNNVVDDRKEDEICNISLSSKKNKTTINLEQVDSYIKDKNNKGELEIIETEKVKSSDTKLKGEEKTSMDENCSEPKEMENAIFIDDNNSSNNKTVNPRTEYENIPKNERLTHVQNENSNISKELIEDIPRHSDGNIENTNTKTQKEKLGEEPNQGSCDISNNRDVLENCKITNKEKDNNKVLLVASECVDETMDRMEKEADLSSDKINQVSKEKSVVFNTTDCDNKTPTKYPKTPIFSKSKSYIDDDLNVSNEISGSVDLQSVSKILALTNESRNLNCESIGDISEKVNINPTCTLDEETKKVDIHESISDTPYRKANNFAISSSTPIVNLLQKKDVKSVGDGKEEEVQISSVQRGNLSLTGTQNEGRINDYGFSKSWSQAVIGKVDCEKGLAFIDGLEVNTAKIETENKKTEQNELVLVNEERSDKEEEEREKNEFIDDEAMEVDEEYEEYDSMDSEEREYLKNNEIPVRGHNIGSDDTEEEEDYAEEEDNNSISSFIVSSSDDNDTTGGSAEFSSDTSSLGTRNTSKKSKNVSSRAVLIDSTDEENEAKDVNSKVRPQIKEYKRISRRAIVIESSGEESDIGKDVGAENNHENRKNSVVAVESEKGMVEKEVKICNDTHEIKNNIDNAQQGNNNERELEKPIMNILTNAVENISEQESEGSDKEFINEPNDNTLTQPILGNNISSGTFTNTNGNENSVEIDEDIQKNTNPNNSETGIILEEIGKNSDNKNVLSEHCKEKSNLQDVSEVLSGLDSKNNESEDQICETQSTNKIQKVVLINNENLEDNKNKNSKQPKRDQNRSESENDYDINLENSTEIKTPKVRIGRNQEEKGLNSKEYSAEILELKKDKKDCYENLNSSNEIIPPKSPLANKHHKQNQYQQKILQKDTGSNKNESKNLTEEEEKIKKSSNNGDASENLNASKNKVQKSKSISICKKPKLQKVADEEQSRQLFCSQNNKSNNDRDTLSTSITSNNNQRNIPGRKSLSSSFTFISTSGSKQRTEHKIMNEMEEGNMEQQKIPNVSKKHSDEIIEPLNLKFSSEYLSITSELFKQESSDSSEKEEKNEASRSTPSYVAKFKKSEVRIEGIKTKGKNDSCKETTKRETDGRKETKRLDASPCKGLLKKDTKRCKFTEIRKPTETENAKHQKSEKMERLLSIEQIMKRCDKIVEAANEEKKKSKEVNSVSKVKKAKHKKLQKEYENISPISDKLLQANEIAKAVEHGKNLLNKNIKKNIRINEKTAINKTNSSPENVEKFNSFEETHISEKQSNKKRTISDESVDEKSNRNHKQKVKKRKLQISEAKDEEQNSNYKKDINFIKNSSGIFVEESVTPTKKFKITSTLELPTGIVYEQPITPTSKRSNGFQETEATPNLKTLGFKVKSILNAGRKEAPITKQERVTKKKYNIPEPVSVLAKPKWTTSGDFSVAKLHRAEKDFISLNLTGSTEFVVAPLQSKKAKLAGNSRPAINIAAAEFKNKSLYNDRINRGTSKELLQRKEKQFVNNKL